MSHTPEQAKELWCPMARVAQTGNTDTGTAYNRTLDRQLRLVNVAVIQNPESFELGTAPMPEQGQIMALDTDVGLSKAARCVADKCAMWRWQSRFEDVKPLRANGFPVMPPPPERLPSTHGYCGLAGRPEVMA